jgi:hypothetical protein
MWTIATVNSVASAISAASHHSAIARPAQMDVLMVFGFLTAFLTLVVWIYQNQSRASQAALATGFAALALYAFLQGAWPIGIAMSVWSAARFQQCCTKRDQIKPLRQRQPVPMRWNEDSRISRMFGEGQLN